MQNVRVSPQFMSRMKSWGGDFDAQMRKAKSLAEVYSLANRLRRSDDRCGVPAVFFNPFIEWHHKQVGLAVGFGGNGRALVAGPGNCGDFPLETLAGRFSEVVLIDVDGEGPELARQRLPAGLRDKVKFLLCDASAFVGSVVERAEEAIRRSQSGDAAAAAVREIICAPPTFNPPGQCDFRGLPFEKGSFDLVLSDDVMPNFYPLPLAWLDVQLKLKFGDACSLSEGKLIPPIQVAAALIHMSEALRILGPGGILALSASVANVTVAVMPDKEERVVYCYQGTENELVLLSAPRFGFDGERHVGVDRFQEYFFENKLYDPVSFAAYQLQLTEAQADALPGIGSTETFLAALHEFACMKKCV